MPLPRIIEFLLAQNPGYPYPGRPLVGQGFLQTVAIIPPLTQIILQRLPGGTSYATIAFQTVFDPQMIPGAFYAEARYWGNQVYGGIVTDWGLQHQLDSFAVITNAQPALAVIQNLTNLNQYYSAAVFFLTIDTEQNWQAVVEVLKRLETTEKMVELQQQASDLLKKMSKGPR